MSAVVDMPMRFRVLGPELSRRLRSINSARAELRALGYEVARQQVTPPGDAVPVLTLQEGDAALLARCSMVRMVGGKSLARFRNVDLRWNSWRLGDGRVLRGGVA